MRCDNSTRRLEQTTSIPTAKRNPTRRSNHTDSCNQNWSVFRIEFFDTDGSVVLEVKRP